MADTLPFGVSPTGRSYGGPGVEQGGVTGGQPAGQTPQTVNTGTPSQDVYAFISNYQQTHPAADLNGLLTALKQAGYQNVDHFMYGSTPSGNELSINGQKYKVIAGENSGSPSWYVAGTNDSGGGPAGGDMGGAFGSLNQPFQAPTGLNFMNDPGYQERLKLGTDAIQNSAAARGTLLTGGTLKDLNNYAQNFASNEYGNVYNRAFGQFQDNTIFNRNLSLAQLGLQGAGLANQAGSQYADNYAGANSAGANAQAAGAVAGANNNSALAGNLGNIGSNVINWWQANHPSNLEPSATAGG